MTWDDLDRMTPQAAHEWFEEQKRGRRGSASWQPWCDAQAAYSRHRKALRKAAGDRLQAALQRGDQRAHHLQALRVREGLMKKAGGAELSGPQSVRETRDQHLVNDQLRSHGGVVRIETGNVERRLKEKRWREGSKR